MNISFLSFFILFTYSFSAFAGPWQPIRNLVVDIIDGSSNRNFSELEREFSLFTEDASFGFDFHRGERSMDNIVANVSGDFEHDVDVAAILYSLAIRSESSGSPPQKFFQIVLGDLDSRLSGSGRLGYYDIEEVLSSPYFFLPSIGRDPHNYRGMVFGYVKGNFDVIYEEGYSTKIILRWWDCGDFREMIFDSIEKKHLNDPDFLLKWWEQDRISETGYLRDFLAPYVIRGNGNHGLFWETFLKAVKENRELAREFEFLKGRIRKIRNSSSREIRALGRSVSELKSWEIKALTSRQIKALTSKQIKSLTSAQIRAFTSNQMGYFTPDQIRAFTPDQFREFSAIQLSKVSLRGLNSDQVQAIPDEVVRALPPRRKRDLLSLPPSVFQYNGNLYGNGLRELPAFN